MRILTKQETVMDESLLAEELFQKYLEKYPGAELKVDKFDGRHYDIYLPFAGEPVISINMNSHDIHFLFKDNTGHLFFIQDTIFLVVELDKKMEAEIGYGK